MSGTLFDTARDRFRLGRVHRTKAGPESLLTRDRDAEVSEHIPPDTVDVIGAILRVVELDQECRPLDAIGVRLRTVGRAEPGEPDRVGTRLADLTDPGL